MILKIAVSKQRINKEHINQHKEIWTNKLFHYPIKYIFQRFKHSSFTRFYHILNPFHLDINTCANKVSGELKYLYPNSFLLSPSFPKTYSFMYVQ